MAISAPCSISWGDSVRTPKDPLPRMFVSHGWQVEAGMSAKSSCNVGPSTWLLGLPTAWWLGFKSGCSKKQDSPVSPGLGPQTDTSSLELYLLVKAITEPTSIQGKQTWSQTLKGKDINQSVAIFNLPQDVKA